MLQDEERLCRHPRHGDGLDGADGRAARHVGVRGIGEHDVERLPRQAAPGPLDERGNDARPPPSAKRLDVRLERGERLLRSLDEDRRLGPAREQLLEPQRAGCPAYRSSARRPRSRRLRAPRMLKSASRTRSDVGRVAVPFGALRGREPYSPPVMRIVRVAGEVGTPSSASRRRPAARPQRPRVPPRRFRRRLCRPCSRRGTLITNASALALLGDRVRARRRRGARAGSLRSRRGPQRARDPGARARDRLRRRRGSSRRAHGALRSRVRRRPRLVAPGDAAHPSGC